MDLDVSRICATARFSEAVGKVMNKGVWKLRPNDVQASRDYRESMTLSEIERQCYSAVVTVNQ